MAVPIWKARVVDGRVRWDRPQEAQEHVQSLEGKRVDVVIRREVKHLSGNQRRYYHGVVLDTFARESGRSRNELKALMKLKFLWDGETVDRFGLPVVPSTEELTDKQYGELIDHTLQLAAECGIYIPAAGEAE